MSLGVDFRAYFAFQQFIGLLRAVTTFFTKTTASHAPNTKHDGIVTPMGDRMRIVNWAGALVAGIAICATIMLLADRSQGQPEPDLGQGWTHSDRDWWYSVSQGSRLLPLKWAKALETSDSSTTVLSDKNIRKFNYLTNPTSTLNKQGLPLGFALDTADIRPGDNHQVAGACHNFPKMCSDGVLKQDWIGLNCAACHTNDIAYHGTTLRVDGAATLANFQGFFEEILNALKLTASDTNKFNRFAANVLGAQNTPGGRQNLQAELGELISWEQRLYKKNDAPVPYGFGRLDAQGHILNKISEVVDANPQTNDFPSDAPASYPFIWNAPQHDFVQWNGVAQNGTVKNLTKYVINGKPTDIGALGRNVGEVIGVFAQVDTTTPDTFRGYKSTVRIANLIDIERQLGRLRSPQWPANLFGPIKDKLADRGAVLFNQRCASCHASLNSGDLQKPIKADMEPLWKVGTDVWLACNTYLHRSVTGNLEGRQTELFAGPRFEHQDRTATMLVHTITATIAGERNRLAQKALDDLFSGVQAERGNQAMGLFPGEYLPGVSNPLKKARARQCIEDSRLQNFAALGLAYKARPLNGIWATAPYLHNGSVPTLYDLLLPATVQNFAAQPLLAGDAPPKPPYRPESFYVGSREFDPVHVGFQDGPDSGGLEFRVREKDGTPILGNYNSGHDYGTDLNEADRLALVEYLKRL